MKLLFCFPSKNSYIIADSSVENCQKDVQRSYIHQQSEQKSDLASVPLRCVSSEEVSDTRNKKCKLRQNEESSSSSSSQLINVTGSSKKYCKSKILNSTFPVSLVKEFLGTKTDSLHGNSYQNEHLTRKTRSASIDASNLANVSVEVQTKYNADESRYSSYSRTQPETSSSKFAKLTRSNAKSGIILKAHEPRSQCRYLAQRKSKNHTKDSTTNSTSIKSVRKSEQEFNFPFTRSTTEKSWKRQKNNTKSPTSYTNNKIRSSDKTDVRKGITPRYNINCRSTKSRPSSNNKNLR